MKTPQFKTFRALADYARGRAVKSAKRNDPIAWAYWRDTADWALLRACSVDAIFGGDAVRARYGISHEEERRGEAIESARWRDAAVRHSRMKWCAAILRANGQKVHLSLQWMHNLEEVPA